MPYVEPLSDARTPLADFSRILLETVGAGQQGVTRYLTFYNQQRPHRALDGKTPDQVYCTNLATRLTAA